MRTQREAIVTSSGGTKSASTRNVVDAGGSSIDLSSGAAASAVHEVEVVEHEHLAVALDRRQRRDQWTISSACRREIAGPTRSTSWTSGCSPARARRAARRSGGRRRRAARAANARAASCFVDPGGPTKR